MSSFQDLTGMQFERLRVLERTEDLITLPSGHRTVRWRCRCKCGNEVIVSANNLRSGATKSCGCLRKEAVRKANTGVARRNQGKGARTT